MQDTHWCAWYTLICISTQAWGWMSTCSWRSVTHQLNLPSLTHSTLPSSLTNIGLWRQCRKLYSSNRRNVPTCQHWTGQSWWRDQRSREPLRLLVRLSWSWCFGRRASAETFIFQGYDHYLQEPTSGDNFSVSRVSTLYFFLCSLVLYLNGWFEAFQRISFLTSSLLSVGDWPPPHISEPECYLFTLLHICHHILTFDLYCSSFICISMDYWVVSPS